MGFSTDQRQARRYLLKLLGGGALATLAGPAAGVGPAAHAQTAVKTRARIVIAGAGAAGLSMAARLARALDGATIDLIDARKDHYYQPGFTLVGGGIKPASYVVSDTADYVPAGVNWTQETVVEIDPEARQVTTQSGKQFAYDFLVVATGMELAYDKIEGMSPELIGQHGIGSIYNGPEAARATWQAMSRFADEGGRGVFTRPDTEMKCAGAPIKYTFIADDHLVRQGTKNKAEIAYCANNDALFSVPIVSEKVRMLFEERQIGTHYSHVLHGIDPGRRRLTFKTLGGMQEQDYDFVHVVPPMRAPEVIRNSPLPVQDGAWADQGWMQVDRGTLRHERYPNVFGVGDIAGVPKGKTAASVKWQVPVVVDHLVAEVAGRDSDALYTGYTSCPLITRLGRAMLVEFDYNDNLVPSFPGVIAPLEELWVSWVMKTMALKPTYVAMLRGRA